MLKRDPYLANFVVADEINRAPAKVPICIVRAMQKSK